MRKKMGHATASSITRKEDDASEMSAVLRTRRNSDSMMKSLEMIMEDCVIADVVEIIREAL